MWSNRINSLWLHKLYHWPVAILYKLSDAGFDMGRIGAGCAYKCLPMNAVTWQGREGFLEARLFALSPLPEDGAYQGSTLHPHAGLLLC